jgi:hypothetical protein
MALIRATFFFKQLDYGWTESYWTNADSVSAQDLLQKSDKLAGKRAKMLGADGRLTYVRHSAEGVFRDASYNSYPGGGLAGDSTAASDAPTVALLLYQSDATRSFHRNTYLRGNHDNVVFSGGLYTPSAAFIATVNDYKAALFADGWGWLAATNRQQAYVQNCQQDPGGTVSITLASDLFAAPFGTRLKVSISGVKGAANVNGPQVVQTITARSCVTVNRIPILPYTSGGKVSMTQREFKAIAAAAITRVASRGTGRPSFLSAGRRKAQAES